MGTNGHELSPGGTIADGPPDGGSGPAIGQGAGPAAVRSRTGRPPAHSLTSLRKTMTRLGTKRLDRRSAVAVAARRFKAELTADLGGDPSRAQATLIELAARTWIIVEALDDWLMRQPSLVLHRKRTVVPVLLQRQQLADSLARLLERLGLERKARDVTDLATYLATRGTAGDAARTPAPRPQLPQEPREPASTNSVTPGAAPLPQEHRTEAGEGESPTGAATTPETAAEAPA